MSRALGKKVGQIRVHSQAGIYLQTVDYRLDTDSGDFHAIVGSDHLTDTTVKGLQNKVFVLVRSNHQITFQPMIEVTVRGDRSDYHHSNRDESEVELSYELTEVSDQIIEGYRLGRTFWRDESGGISGSSDNTHRVDVEPNDPRDETCRIPYTPERVDTLEEIRGAIELLRVRLRALVADERAMDLLQGVRRDLLLQQIPAAPDEGAQRGGDPGAATAK